MSGKAISRRRIQIASLIAVTLLSLALYARNVDDPFIGDDFDLIHSFHGRGLGYFAGLLVNDESGSVWDYLCREPGSICPDPERHGFLRPLKIWLLGLEFQLFGTWSTGFHLTSSLIFAFNVVLAFLLLRRLVPRHPPVALLGAAGVAVHPVFAEIVPSITYREEILASGLALGAVLALVRHRQGQGGAAGFHVCYALALLTKESAASTLGLAVGYDAVAALFAERPLEEARRRLRLYAATPVILAAYFGLRLAAFGNFVGGHGETDFTSLERLTSFHVTLFRYQFLQPMFAFASMSWLRWLVPLLAAAACALVIRRRRRLHAGLIPALLFTGPVWYAASTAIAYGVYFSPRHTVMAVLGFILFGAVLLGGVSEALRLRRPMILFLASGLLAALAWLPPSLEMSRRYDEASRFVQRILDTVERETAGLPDGSRVLLLGVPQFRGLPPPFFGHGLRSALQAPFSQAALQRRGIVVEALENPPPAGSGTDYDLVLSFSRPVRRPR